MGEKKSKGCSWNWSVNEFYQGILTNKLPFVYKEFKTYNPLVIYLQTQHPNPEPEVICKTRSHLQKTEVYICVKVEQEISMKENCSSRSRKGVVLWSHLGNSMKVFLAIIFAALGCVIVFCFLLPCVVVLGYLLATAAVGSGIDSIGELAFNNHGDHKYFGSDENDECCICLSCYGEEQELHALPCNHHFHNRCIVRWLKINPSCPLCKHRVLYSVSY